MSEVGAGSGAAMPFDVVGVAPAPFSVIAGQTRAGDGKLYTMLTFLTTFGTFVVLMDGDAGMNFLGSVDPVMAATKAGIELAKGNGNA